MSDLVLSRAALRMTVQRGYNEPYIIHQLVADLFGDRDDRGYLYRVVSRAPREANVLVLSRAEPTPGPERAWGRTSGLESRAYDPELEAGQHLDYEIRINATRVVTQDDGSKPRFDVWDVVFEEEPDTERTPHDVYHEYLKRKLDGIAQLLDCRVVERGMTKVARADRRSIPFVATNLIGSLRVTEPKRLLEEMARGFGRSKAFGCGLLCLSRPGSILPRRYPGLSVQV